MWLVGGLIGLLLGVAAGHSLWLLGALLGGVAGTLIGRQRARQSQGDQLPGDGQASTTLNHSSLPRISLPSPGNPVLV